jgi:phosphopantetheinyl transferase (holo-ACP synthase)
VCEVTQCPLAGAGCALPGHAVFSAKESFSKAIGMGMRMPMTWRLCEVGKLPSGKPTLVLHGGLKDWFEARSLTAHVSVTDETDYAPVSASWRRIEEISAPSQRRWVTVCYQLMTIRTYIPEPL